MQSRSLIVLGLLFLGIITIAAQSVEKRFKVHGQLIDARTKKGIKKIPFTVVDYKRNVEADAKGAFLYNMPAGTHTFLIDYYPFDKKKLPLIFNRILRSLSNFNLHLLPGTSKR